MTKFTLATLATPDGPKAAIGVAGKYYLLETVQPLLRDATCKTVLENWDKSTAIARTYGGSASAEAAKSIRPISPQRLRTC